MESSSPRSTMASLSGERTASVATSIRLNNIGVRCIHTGSMEEAVDFLKSGMTMLKSVIEDYVRKNRRRERLRQQHDQEQFQQEDSYVVESRPQATFVTADNSESNIGAEEDLTWSDSVDLQSDSSHLFVFRCPLQIANENVSFPESYAEVSLILTYNLALVYHLIGSNDWANPDRERIKKALDLYSMSLDLLLRDKAIKSNTVIMVSAILNNMAVAHAVLGNNEMCRKFLRRMLSIIMIELASNRSEQLGRHVAGFFYNINFFMYEKPSAAAA